MGKTVILAQDILDTVVTVADSAALALISGALTYDVPGARFMPACKTGRWDGKMSLFDRRARSFPAGLTQRVKRILTDGGWDVTVRPCLARAVPRAPYAPSVCGVELRKYQEAAVADALHAGRAVVHAPTGSGKTEIGAEIVRRLGLRTLWVVHRTDLLSQTADRLRARLGMPIACVGSGHHECSAITVGMVQSLARVRDAEWWRQWEVLILDETHHAGATTWYTVASRCSRAGWRFGLSATPLTGEPLRDARLEAATGQVIHVGPISEMVAAGFLARPRIVLLRPVSFSYPTYEQVRDAVLPDWRDDPRRLEKMGGRLYAEAYERGVVRNEARHREIADVALRHVGLGEKTLVLCTRLDHGERLHAAIALRSAGPTWWLSGADKPKTRDKALSAFRHCERGSALVASEIFREGIDVPEIDVLVLAGGGLSDLATLQRVGRALRRRLDKAEVLIYDVWDGRAGRKDYLRTHAAARLALYRRQGFEVTEDGRCLP